MDEQYLFFYVLRINQRTFMKPFYLFLTLCCGSQLMVNGHQLNENADSSYFSRQIDFKTAVNMMLENNPSLKAAEKNIELSRRQTQLVSASWFPTITMTGTYVAMSDKISVSQEYASLLEPIKDKYDNTFLVSDVIDYISNELGDLSFDVPIMKNDFGSLDMEVIFPIFTGIKRVYAYQLSKDNETLSEYEKETIEAAKYLELADVYFSLRLAESMILVFKETKEMTQNHYTQALKMEGIGMFDKAERLIAKVALDESDRNLKSVMNNADALRKALFTIIGQDTSPESQKNNQKHPTTSTSLFMSNNYPSIEWFKDMMKKNAFIFKQSELQQDISQKTLRISQSNYFPVISLFGKQTIASYHIPNNLMPNTIAGINMTWDIFDGLARERSIQMVKIESEMITETQNNIKDELEVAVNEWYAQLRQSCVDANDLKSSLEFAEEVYKIRKKAFIEGLATSQQVLDAMNLLNKTKLLLLSAYYKYDIAMAHLCCLCGIAEYFESFISDNYETIEE